ncbi:MAG: FtsX-like permease family protein [Bacteroidaceae bacterium]|nr:FtsX-like permease family protein [Bacteroidaceae bacterium]MBQ9189999.1 FtsX-like permease family protein [Bacteroidaceae bacterium]
MKSLFYLARRFKTATALNLVGLTVAFAAFYLFMTQVRYNAGYNRSFPDAERLLRVEAKMNQDSPWGTHCNRPLLEYMIQMPEVESGTIVSFFTGTWDFYLGESPITYSTSNVRNESGLETFGMECLDGKLHWDEGEQGILISASMAERFLGTTMAAGRHLWDGKDSIRVQGVYRDLPANTFLTDIPSNEYPVNGVFFAMGDENRHNFSEWSSIGYLRIYDAVDFDAFRAEFRDRFKTAFRKAVLAENSEEYDKASPEEKAEIEQQVDDYFGKFDLRATPITETYFSGVGSNDRGNRTVHLILLWACAIILVVAAINFLNFTLAEAPMRVKGVNTRRVLGSTLWSLRLGLIGEAVATSLVAFALSLGLVHLLSEWPPIAELFSGDISLTANLPSVVPVLAALSVVIGIVAGTYPAFFVTSFQPALALKGSFGLTPKGRRLRTGLVALQLFVSLVLVAFIGILYLQSHFIFHSDYGYDKDQIIYAQLPAELMQKKDAIRSELMQMGGVEEVSYSNFVLGSQTQYMGWGRGTGDKTVTFTCLPVDWRYLRTMGIKVIEGRDFNEHDGDCYIINEAARKRWSWVEMDKPLTDEDMPVIGVCENIRYGSVRQDRAEDPVAFVILGESYAQWGDRLGILNAHLTPGVDMGESRRLIEEKLVEMNGGNAVTVRFLDQILENLYQEEFRFISQVLLFSIICLVITLIGVFCLTLFETEYRRKEIGIRKVFGSTEEAILLMLSRRYVLLILVAFVLGAPLAWYIGSQWLMSFAERTPIYWWLFPLSLLAVSVITLATVGIQGWRAATENPVNSIKTE